jgi:hypothetical protein
MLQAAMASCLKLRWHHVSSCDGIMSQAAMASCLKLRWHHATPIIVHCSQRNELKDVLLVITKQHMSPDLKNHDIIFNAHATQIHECGYEIHIQQANLANEVQSMMRHCRLNTTTT